MKNIDPVDLSKFILSIQNGNSVQLNEIIPGPPTATTGINLGLAEMDTSPPHNGERHNDGDEIIIMLSGIIAVESDSNPNQYLEMKAGDTCIIRKGEWHKIKVIEKTKLIYITPGENNEHRF